MELILWDSGRKSFRTTDENSIGTAASSSVVGLDRTNSKNNYILVRYAFAVPKVDENGTNITSLKITNFKFTAASGKAYSVPSKGKNALDTDLYVYGVVSNNPELGPSTLKLDSRKFLVESTLTSQGASKTQISADANIDLAPGDTYYLYLFTENPGGSYRTAYLY